MSSTAPVQSPLPLASAFNLRDFGGHATGDGQRVRRGMLYRSGTMALLSEADADQLRSLGIQAICDFRRPSERHAEPTVWHGADVDYYCRDYSGSSGVLGDMMREGRFTADAMRGAMITLYRDIHVDHAESYRAMFSQILAGRVPILINCAAGKDRTGVGAALILAALGVPRATIVEDYLLTNTHADWDWRLAQGDSAIGRARQAHAGAMEPLLAADTAYLETLFDTLDAAHGGIDGYLADILGVDAGARDTLCRLLLD